MIRCAHCGALMARDRNCSDLAVLVLHWMDEHPREYAERHPESRSVMAEAGLL